MQRARLLCGGVLYLVRGADEIKAEIDGCQREKETSRPPTIGCVYSLPIQSKVKQDEKVKRKKRNT